MLRQLISARVTIVFLSVIRALYFLFDLLFRVSAFYEGDSETVSLMVLVDDVTIIDDWTSSGTTLDFQTISLVGIEGQIIQLLADSLEDEAFLDITEVRGNEIERKQALERVVQRSGAFGDNGWTKLGSGGHASPAVLLHVQFQISAYLLVICG